MAPRGGRGRVFVHPLQWTGTSRAGVLLRERTLGAPTEGDGFSVSHRAPGPSRQRRVDASGPCEWPIVAGRGATMAERARAGGEPEDGRAHQSLTVTTPRLPAGCVSPRRRGRRRNCRWLPDGGRVAIIPVRGMGGTGEGGGRGHVPAALLVPGAVRPRGSPPFTFVHTTEALVQPRQVILPPDAGAFAHSHATPSHSRAGPRARALSRRHGHALVVSLFI